MQFEKTATHHEWPVYSDVHNDGSSWLPSHELRWSDTTPINAMKE